MALAAVNANIARQKAYNAVYGSGKTATPVSPYYFYAVKSFFLHLDANKNNPDLQFVPYSTAQITTDGGYQPIGAGACKVYLWYGLGARTSGTTASFQAIHDAADNTATTTTIATQRINATGQSFLMAFPDGFPIATQITLSAATAVGGATESSASDACNGFVLLGA